MMQIDDSLFEDLTRPNVKDSSPPCPVFLLTDSFPQTTTVTYTTSTITTRPSPYPDQQTFIFQTPVSNNSSSSFSGIFDSFIKQARPAPDPRRKFPNLA